jgi:capsid assembly protease
VRNETIRRALAGTAWFVHEPKMRELIAFFEARLNGGKAEAETLAKFRAENDARKERAMELLAISAYKDDEDFERMKAARAENVSASAAGSVAVVPVYGVICHRADMFSEYSGGTSTEKLAQQIRQAVNDPNVKAIVMDFDTPGGSTDGVDELAAAIFSARKKKSITAVSNCLCTSAGYYLAAQCTEVVVSPSSMTGSIGVYCEHEDYSAALEKAGIKISLISFGENKTEGNSTEPLTDAAREHLQEMVNTFGVMFENPVARGRGVSQDEVHKKFGQGRVFDAKQAVKLGLADRVATLDDVLAKYGVTRAAGARAAIEAPGLQATAPVADLDCTCGCVACVDGDCTGCDCSGCDSESCTAASCNCGQGESESAKKKAHAARERRLQIAGV